jgi:hypothetical protein
LPCSLELCILFFRGGIRPRYHLARCFP